MENAMSYPNPISLFKIYVSNNPCRYLSLSLTNLLLLDFLIMFKLPKLIRISLIIINIWIFLTKKQIIVKIHLGYPNKYNNRQVKVCLYSIWLPLWKIFNLMEWMIYWWKVLTIKGFLIFHLSIRHPHQPKIRLIKVS